MLSLSLMPLLLRLLLLLLPSLCITAGALDMAAWDEVVHTYVQPGTLQGVDLNVVNYTGVNADPNFLLFKRQIATTNLSALNRNETIAFMINTYNAFAIDSILREPCFPNTCTPIQSILNLSTSNSSVWNQPAGIIGGAMYTLDDIEDYLRNPQPWPEDPRIHACIVCASISCPNVCTEAFAPERLDSQLTDQMVQFLDNTKKGLSLDAASDSITLSPIFEWFVEDFTRNQTLLQFLKPYMPAHVAIYVDAHPKVQLEYFAYDWDVDGALEPSLCGCSG